MTFTIELPNQLHRQAEAYAASKNKSLETLVVSFLQESLANANGSQEAIQMHSETNGNGSQVAVEADSEAEVWDQVFDEVMEDYANVWERLAQL